MPDSNMDSTTTINVELPYQIKSRGICISVGIETGISGKDRLLLIMDREVDFARCFISKSFGQ